MSTDDSGPAFPHWKGNGMARYTENGPEMIMECTGGLTIRQYAAIHLRVPQSGIGWLDEMIREANKPDIVCDDPTISGGKVAGQFTMKTGEPQQGKFVPDQPDYYDGEWHEWRGGWRGGLLPVLSRTVVLVQCRSGSTSREPCPAASVRWSHCGQIDDIIRFRVVKP